MEDGTVYSTGDYINGKPTGVHRTYYKSGNIYESVSYQNGVKHGLKEIYFNNGNLFQMESFSNGMLHGASKIFRNSQLDEVIHYYEDVKHGEYIEYDDGKIQITGQYEMGVPVGQWKTYFTDEEELHNVVEREIMFVNGKPQNPVKIYELSDDYFEYSEGYSDKVDKKPKQKYYWLGNVDVSDLNEQYISSRLDERGEWKLYDMSGNMIAKTLYNNEGQELEEFVYYWNGKLAEKNVYVIDVSKEYKEFYINGDLKRHAKYDYNFGGNIKDNISVSYYPDGKLRHETKAFKQTFYFNDGSIEMEKFSKVKYEFRLPIKTIEYYPNGEIKSLFTNNYLEDRKLEEYVSKAFYESGKLKEMSVHLYNDDRSFDEDVDTYYDENEKLIRLVKEVNGKLVKDEKY